MIAKTEIRRRERALKRLRAELRDLRAKRAFTLHGHGLPWGLPWCAGPGSAYHQGGACEGCCTREYCRDRAVELDPQIRALTAEMETLTMPAEPVQGVLFA